MKVRGIRTWAILLWIGTAAFAAAGCDSGGPQTVLIHMKTPGGGNVLCQSWLHEDIQSMTSVSGEEAAKAGAEWYETELYGPGVLWVNLEAEANTPQDRTKLLCLWDGRSSRLSFHVRGPALWCNGNIVSLRLAPDCLEWLEAVQAAQLRAVRWVTLSGFECLDRKALSLLPPGEVKGWSLENYRDGLPAAIADAVVASQPVALVLSDSKEHDALLKRCPSVRYLKAPSNQDLTPVLPRLEELILQIPAGANGSLDWLAGASGLRGLALHGHHEPPQLLPRALWGLKTLKTLVMLSPELTDLEPLSGLSNLRELSLFECRDLRDLSAATKLQSLRSLMLSGLPENVTGIDSLAKIKSLKVLIVDKSHLQSHKADYDRLREKRPDVKVVGFCVGSWLIGPVVLLAGIGGTLWRTARHRSATRQTTAA